MKIAMWSGPRNLSTAMMYAFANRADFAVWDEPFYGAYLKATGIDHPMRDVVMAAHETDAAVVAAACAGRPPEGRPNWYMKHMTFHMRPGFDLAWAADCVNIHLLRHPARVIASYAEKRANFTFEDIGFRQQVEIFERFPGPVVDSFETRQNPKRVLRTLCAQIGLPWDPAMLSWPAGPRDFDGAWAPHWYGAVHKSTGFAGTEGPLPKLTGEAARLLDQAMPFYEQMKRA